MGRTPFYRRSNELEHHFPNIERTLTCSSIVDQTQKKTTFGFEHTNIEPNRAFNRFTKLLIELARTSFFRTSNEPKHTHVLVIKLD